MDQTQRGTDENKRATRDTRGAPRERHSLTKDEDIEEENIRNGEEALKQMSKMAEYAENPEDIIIENAMYRSDIGQIDFVWGKPGTGPKFKKGYGISHIIAKHGENTAWKVVDVIAKGTEYDTQEGNSLQPGQYRLRLFYDDYTVVLSKDTNSKHWVLTAWDNDKETAVYATVEGNGSIGATAATPMLTRRNGVDTAVSKQSLSNEGEIVKQKFSIDDEDNNGRQLSDGQKAYFNNSVVRDDKGRLLTVYHGTDADFTEFDFMRAGKNGRAEGYGFYFSDDQVITGKYGDKQMEVYLNITKPLYSDRRTLTKAELRKFTDAVISREMKSDDIEWKDSFISNYIDTYSGISRSAAVQRFVNQIWEANENDQDLIYEIANGSGQNYSVETMKDFYQTLTESIGVDGNISTWTHADGESKVYVAFSPEQAKRVDNQEPTRNPDIRFSFDDEDYLLAVEAGDMDAAQQMVDEAAQAAGYIPAARYAALGALLNESTYDALTEARAAGISCRVFMGFRSKEADLKADKDPDDPEKTIAGSKKEKVVDLIDSLQLTREQKDVLYLMYYTESGLYDTPWH